MTKEARSSNALMIRLPSPAALAVIFMAALMTPVFAGDETGVGVSLAGKQIFPVDNAWNRDISSEAVDPNSTALLASIGLGKGLHPDFGTTYNGNPNGIPYVVVSGTQARVPVKFEYADESDPGP